MKTMIAFLLIALAPVSFASGLVIVERDIRDVLPLSDGVTVYHVAENWFLAEAPASWGETVAESAEGLYIAHLSDENAQVPGRAVFSRDGMTVFEPLSPLPLTAHPGIRQITPLRPYNEAAFRQPVQLPFGGSRDMVSEIVGQLSEDSLKSHIQNLQDFQTRLCITPQFFESAFWVAAKYESYGLESVAVDTFDFTFYGNPYQSANVQAELPGTLEEPGIVLITGHLDAITYTSPYEFAPGADDNASGCATVLEAARILSQYEFPNTLRFVCFGAEELGLIGSEYYAENSYNLGENIVAVMNLDMILYGPESNRALFVPYNSTSEFIAGMFGEVAGTYVPELELNVMYSPGTTYSDHAPFWQNGYAALLGIEAAIDDNPHYHQDSDILENYEEFWPFGTECAKAALAFTAQAALTDWLGIEGTAPASVALTVFPNPASTILGLSLGGEAPAGVSLFDITGRMVLSGSGATLDVSGLAPGVYLVRAATEGGFCTARVVLTR